MALTKTPVVFLHLDKPAVQLQMGITAWRMTLSPWLCCFKDSHRAALLCLGFGHPIPCGTHIPADRNPCIRGMGFASPGCRHRFASYPAPFHRLLFEPGQLCCICKTHRCNQGNSIPNWIGTAWSNWLFGSSRFESSCARLNRFARLYQLGKLCGGGDLVNDLLCF